jgi:hypothetical protein
MESRRRQSNKRSTRKQVRRLAKRGGSKRSEKKRRGVSKRGGGAGCGVYKGGAMNNPVPGPAPVPIGSRFRNACIALNQRIAGDEAMRHIVKRYLERLYGTSETWKALRRPPPGGVQDDDFDGLPEDVKALVQNLLAIVLEIYETGNEATETLIFIHLTNHNLYYLTRQQVNAGENDRSNRSSNYESSNNEDEEEEVVEEQNDPSMGSPRSQGSQGSHSSNMVGTP